ncbi:MAG: aldehyde dehydrogenase family protein [Clostridiales bacterium]|nr:aldehyde dehydrogenase family protein [Clostridiales bacterium]
MGDYTKQYIGGEWRIGTARKTLSNYNPYNGELLYTYQSAGEKDLDDAFHAANNAQKSWALTSPEEKQGYLTRLYQAIVDKKSDIFHWLKIESGATVAKASFEYNTTLEFAKVAMSFPLMMEGKILPSNIPGKENYIFRQPKGVIGVIAPWNVPLVLAMRSVIPAIATGNAVVLKPASDTPASALLIAELFEKAGFPAGLYNAVCGSGSEIGDTFVSHPIPGLISFTGSTEVGRRIGEIAGKHLKDVSLELGGNNAMLILKDADVKQAAKAAAFGSFFNQGQVCMAVNRVIAVNEIYDEFVSAFVNVTKDLKAGDPGDPETFFGPVINESQIRTIEKYIFQTIKAGAHVALEGKTEGSVVRPWILSNVHNDMPAAKNEVFGPVCCVIRARDEAHAVEIANDTEYGLSGSVFTKDIYHGILIARMINSGMTHVNDQSINDEPHVMFGGEKASGLGRFNAQWVVNKFTTEKWVSIQKEDRYFF